MILGINDFQRKIIIDILSTYHPEFSFYFYGSRVKGGFEKTSDLDILIKGRQEVPQNILAEMLKLFDESDLPFIVNLTDYSKIDKGFYDLIKNDLVSLY
jgi:predicted nucleotidyltransferase